MEWYWIVLLTILCYNFIAIILAQFDENLSMMWSAGIVFPILKILTYPIRANKRYNGSYKYYQKHGISKLQYIFGKRVQKNED